MLALAVEPENSLDTAAAAVAAVTAPAQSNISPGSQGRRNIHRTHPPHPAMARGADSIHSRTFPMFPHFRGYPIFVVFQMKIPEANPIYRLEATQLSNFFYKQVRHSFTQFASNTPPRTYFRLSYSRPVGYIKRLKIASSKSPWPQDIPCSQVGIAVAVNISGASNHI